MIFTDLKIAFFSKIIPAYYAALLISSYVLLSPSLLQSIYKQPAIAESVLCCLPFDFEKINYK